MIVPTNRVVDNIGDLNIAATICVDHPCCCVHCVAKQMVERSMRANNTSSDGPDMYSDSEINAITAFVFELLRLTNLNNRMSNLTLPYDTHEVESKIADHLRVFNKLVRNTSHYHVGVADSFHLI